MLNLKEKIKYRNILRRSINQNYEKAKYYGKLFRNDNFNELLKSTLQVNVTGTLKLKL